MGLHKSMSNNFLLIWITCAAMPWVVFGAFGMSDKVLLRDVQVLTLRYGQMTNARRSSPVPQLKCMGGSAGCNTFVPQVVQCTNRGSDGYDVQWECKTDMDNSYRFGSVEVSCEGFDYPDDPYILKGSCGLEYKIDLTEEGYQKKQYPGQQSYSGQQNVYDQSYHDRSSYPSQYSYSKKAGSIIGDLFVLVAIAGVIFVVYKLCIAGGRPEPVYPHDSPSSDYHGNRPPPAGFRPEYMPQAGHCYGTGASGYSSGASYGNTGTGASGFWTGAATGGFLGYLFGNRNRGYYGSTYAPPNTYYRPNSWWGGNTWSSPFSSWGSGSTGYSTSYGGAPSRSSTTFSSGTRTASGFGGTKRR
ncbi:hypothetical protein ACJMK2_041922 [Sinanodonta woodiana]|uniref:Store-operated calcium entry-associated regulatory factor n=1 Tax=Sinanodonta woodiana TaxID=1069815 RepID=A0ABD3W8P9_SINWO